MRHYTIKPKSQRTLHVINQSGYQYQNVPTIILHGKWLGGFGFTKENKVLVSCKDGEIVWSTVSN